MTTISFARHQFPPDIMRHLLAERGLDVSYETVRRWVLKFGPLFARELRRRRHRPTSQWHLDEMVILIGGRRFWLWRAVDDEGKVLDLLCASRFRPLSQAQGSPYCSNTVRATVTSDAGWPTRPPCRDERPLFFDKAKSFIVYRFGWVAPVGEKPVRTLRESHAMVGGVGAISQTKTMLRATVDFDRPGTQTGFIQVPHSVHDDAWGVIPVPIAVISNGAGPTVVLEGGNHGDEYEGPIVLGELVRTLDPGAVSGRLIFIPAINLPAVAAARRTSPIDNLNFNRAFPGDPLGSPTQQIVAYVNDVLFPMADAFLDLHSGGSSLAIVPSAIIKPVADPEQHARNTAATLAFGAPMTVAIDNRGDPRTATASAARAGLTVVGTEMAGAGTVSIDALALCRRGVRNVLAHLRALPPEMADPPKTASRVYDLPGPNAYVLATDEGVFEPFHTNGAAVRAGQPAGRIHFLVDPSRPPVELTYGADGVLYGRRQPGKVRPGNCCLVVARPLDAA